MQKGARVALMMPNVLQYPIATAAVLRAGYAVVNVNPLYTPRELMLELARGVERIDVHHGIAGAQHGGGRDGYCSTFGIISATRAPFCMPLLCK